MYGDLQVGGGPELSCLAANLSECGGGAAAQIFPVSQFVVALSPCRPVSVWMCRKQRGRGHGSGGGGSVMDGQWRGLLQTLAQLRGQETRVSADHEEFHLGTITSYLGYLFKISILNETMNRPNNFYWYFLPALAAPHPLMRRGRAQSRSSDHQH